MIIFRKQLGGKLGDSLQSDLQVNTVEDLLQFSEQKLQDRYGINTGFVHRIYDIASFFLGNSFW